MSVRALEANAIAGRWQTQDRSLIIDISRCGEEFCGRRVVLRDQGVPTDLGCDRMVLRVRLGQKQPQPNLLAFVGQIDLADKGGHYAADVVIMDGRPGRLHIGGRKEDTSPFARSLPLDLEMARVGDAACEPTPTS
jgi:uncharacterized protein (DUF2147 family)